MSNDGMHDDVDQQLYDAAFGMTQGQKRRIHMVVGIGLLLILGGSGLYGAIWAMQKPVGESCHEASSCRGGYCVQATLPGSRMVIQTSTSHGYCSAGCDTNTDCPDTMHCTFLQSEKVCVNLPTRDISESCVSSLDCLHDGECLYKQTNPEPFSPWGKPAYSPWSTPRHIPKYESRGTCYEKGTEAKNKREREKLEREREKVRKQFQKLQYEMQKLRHN